MPFTYAEKAEKLYKNAKLIPIHGDDHCFTKHLGAVYCAAIGGLGALLSKRIVASEVIAYDDLGTEAIRKMTVENLPVVVIVDTEGNNLYETAASDYLASK